MKKEMKPADIRRSGWALIAGAVLFVMVFLIEISSGSSGSALGLLLLVFASLPLLAYGMFGLRARYGEKAGGFGSAMLLIGAILGPVVSVIGVFLGPTRMLWFVPYMGPAIVLAGLVFFGAAALVTRPLARWNVLPILAGIPYPAIVLFYIPVLLTGNWASVPSIPDNLIELLFAVQGIALAVLGYILKSDVPEETAAFA